MRGMSNSLLKKIEFSLDKRNASVDGGKSEDKGYLPLEKVRDRFFVVDKELNKDGSFKKSSKLR